MDEWAFNKIRESNNSNFKLVRQDTLLIARNKTLVLTNILTIIRIQIGNLESTRIRDFLENYNEHVWTYLHRKQKFALSEIRRQERLLVKQEVDFE